LPSSSWIVFAVIFAVGLMLFGIGTAMLRTLREERKSAPAPVTWPQLIDESLVDADARLRADMIERLSIVDTEWSRGVLERARAEEPELVARAGILDVEVLHHDLASDRRGD
jgi:hypothetical protein